MSILQPVSRISRRLAPIGAGFPERNFFRSLRLRLSPQASQDAGTASADVADGLPPGTPAPDFTLPRIGGGNWTLSACRGRRVLLVFVDPGRPCSRDIAPRLNRLHRSGNQEVIAVCRGTRHDAALWADENLAAFPVLVANGQTTAGEYNVHDAPLALELDEQGHVAARGLV